jgi:hypothetical protein
MANTITIETGDGRTARLSFRQAIDYKLKQNN